MDAAVPPPIRAKHRRRTHAEIEQAAYRRGWQARDDESSGGLIVLMIGAAAGAFVVGLAWAVVDHITRG